MPNELYLDITFDRVLQYLFFWLIRSQMGHLHQTWVLVAFLGEYNSQQLTKTDKQDKQHI